MHFSRQSIQVLLLSAFCLQNLACKPLPGFESPRHSRERTTASAGQEINSNSPANGAAGPVEVDLGGLDDEVSFEEYRPETILANQLEMIDPVPWQVFQRRTQAEGAITFRVGNDIDNARFLRARLLKAGSPVSDDWEIFELEGGIFANQSWLLTGPAGGWYELEVLSYDEKRRILTRTLAEQVGIGEVFLVSGQSNSTNCGAPAQASESGMVSSTDGFIWQAGNDPQIGTADGYLEFCRNGSNWPRTGDRLFERYAVPIAFASTGHSGTTVAEWLPGASNSHPNAPPILFDHLSQRAQELGPGGFRAVLWHQGENDTIAGTTSAQYMQRIRSIMSQLETDLVQESIIWAVAQASWCRDGTYPTINNGIWGESAEVRAAQAALWELAKVYQGPDTDTLKDDVYRRLVGPDRRDCHFSGLGLQTVGDMWFEHIVAMLDDIFARAAP